MTTSQEKPSPRGSSDQAQQSHNDKNETDTEPLNSPPSPPQKDKTPTSDEEGASDSEKALSTDAAYDDFVEQNSGRFQDRPLGSRVHEDEVPFVDRALAEVKTLRKRVRSLEEERTKHGLQLEAMIEAVDGTEVGFQNLRKNCDKMMDLLVLGATGMRAILEKRRE
ncbi:hypothetical protein BLS_003963 [Venturia inaequalis]|uniref:Uncharacterized protein n=1 Tax=Venturia inaequalis TaxID=5025 RepID=A0A8H3UMV5_VENIN|nr:hypothetical protein BLS_003963 [Venturia inaequalis]